jgi:ubiquinone/menaquinone biosynthesis C-methylase UbiE
VVGVDSSPEMLARARARVPEATFLPGDLGALPLPDGGVDPVVCALAPDVRCFMTPGRRWLMTPGRLR